MEDILRLTNIIKEELQDDIGEYYSARITGSTLSGETLSFLKHFLQDYQPEHILEFGCGLSTILISDIIHTREKCSFVSVDNVETFINITKKELRYPEDVRFVYAPIRVSWVDYCPFVTYSDRFLDAIQGDGPVDLVLIDGPYGRIFSRDAPLFLISHLLRENSAVMLDDSNRSREQEALALWKKQFGDAIEVLEIPGFHKGLAIILIRKSLPPISFNTAYRLKRLYNACSSLRNNITYTKAINDMNENETDNR